MGGAKETRWVIMNSEGRVMSVTKEGKAGFEVKRFAFDPIQFTAIAHAQHMVERLVKAFPKLTFTIEIFKAVDYDCYR